MIEISSTVEKRSAPYCLRFSSKSRSLLIHIPPLWENHWRGFRSLTVADLCGVFSFHLKKTRHGSFLRWCEKSFRLQCLLEYKYPSIKLTCHMMFYNPEYPAQYHKLLTPFHAAVSGYISHQPFLYKIRRIKSKNENKSVWLYSNKWWQTQKVINSRSQNHHAQVPSSLIHLYRPGEPGALSNPWRM